MSKLISREENFRRRFFEKKQQRRKPGVKKIMEFCKEKEKQCSKHFITMFVDL